MLGQKEIFYSSTFFYKHINYKISNNSLFKIFYHKSILFTILLICFIMLEKLIKNIILIQT